MARPFSVFSMAGCPASTTSGGVRATRARSGLASWTRYPRRRRGTRMSNARTAALVFIARLELPHFVVARASPASGEPAEIRDGSILPPHSPRGQVKFTPPRGDGADRRPSCFCRLRGGPLQPWGLRERPPGKLLTPPPPSVHAGKTARWHRHDPRVNARGQRFLRGVAQGVALEATRALQDRRAGSPHRPF